MAGNEKENFFRVLKRNHPWKVSFPTPSCGISYKGAWPWHFRPMENAQEWKDFWGVTWKVSDGEIFPFLPAVASADLIESLQVPDPHSAEIRQKMEEDYARLDRTDKTLTMDHPYFLYEKGFDILGGEEFLTTLAADEAAANALLDKILSFEMGIAEEYVKFKPDQVHTSDDYGIQHGLAVSPPMWRKYFKPRLKKLYDFYRNALGPDVIISHHSCGHVMPILEDFIELGITILNPLQSTANDMEAAAKITRGRLVIAGAIDGQQILPFGTPAQVREEVFRKLDLFWDNGGYLPMPEKELGVPEENMRALRDAIKEWSALHVENRG